MPDLKPRTALIIKLYQRCERYRCLPFPGSLLEQPAWIMRLFDVIDERKARADSERDAGERRRLEQERLRTELNGRRRY